MRFSDYKPHLEVNDSYLEPTVRVHLEMVHKRMYIPINFKSQLKLNGKILSEYSSNFQTTFRLDNTSSQQNVDNDEENYFTFNMNFTLNKKALKYIEEDRLKRNGDVSLELNISVSRLSFYNNLVSDECDSRKSIYIEQSEWIKNFSSKLGIGDFILLELHQPNKAKFAKAISDMPSDSELKVFLENGLDGAYKQMKKAKDFMQEGKWSDSILALRPVIETFKTGSNRNNVTVELKEYYERSVETDNGWEQFRDLIQNSFDYASKYIHVLGQGANRNNQQLIPVAREEDAYFVYNLCLSTLYWIKRKIER